MENIIHFITSLPEEALIFLAIVVGVIVFLIIKKMIKALFISLLIALVIYAIIQIANNYFHIDIIELLF